MRIWRSIAIAAALLGASAPADAQRRRSYTEQERQAAEAALAGFTSPRLSRFESDRQFRDYLQALVAAARTRGAWASAGRPQFARAQVPEQPQTDAEQPVCPPDEPDCLQEQDAGESIMVTGARVTPSNPSITNNQMRGVEGGDIVKQIGNYLLVLQDARIFVVDTRARGRGLALTDRMNVYRDAQDDIWYDEMLVFGDRVLITGYSYGERATEMSVFRLSPEGRLAREGVFLMSSNDYYDTSNYATRLIGDNLVVYTPFNALQMSRASFRWPVVRRWMPGEERLVAQRRGRPLLDGGNIYRPVRDLRDPTVHTVSVCPLTPAASGGELECRSTAFVGPGGAEWYVTASDAFLWTTPAWGDFDESDNDCSSARARGASAAQPALLYRVPVDGGDPTVLGGRGSPPDQFAMQVTGDRFLALLQTGAGRCRFEEEGDRRPLSFFSAPLDRFGSTVAEAAPAAYTPLPSAGRGAIASRFTETHLVYGSLSRYRRGLPELASANYDNQEEYLRARGMAYAMPPAYAVPVDRPQAVRPLDVRHTVIRAERVGDDIVLTGYRDRAGLQMSLIGLTGRPRIASTLRLDGRFESEGRSHAFTSSVERDGSGIMGLPTVPRRSDTGRHPWRSRASDLSFVEMSEQGELRHVGELRATDRDYGRDDDGNPNYSCEVSCIDWYGNSRPIFTGGRIFGLTGTELVEGIVDRGRILERRRIDLTQRPSP